MESLEHSSSEGEADTTLRESGSGLDRRRFLALSAASALCTGLIERASAEESAGLYGENGKDWFYSWKEIEHIYEQEYAGERKLKNVVTKTDTGYEATVSGVNVQFTDTRFIDGILTHLERMIEAGAARYVHRLDAFHGHIFMDEEDPKWIDFDGVIAEDQLRMLLVENIPDVKILYHNSEHVDPDAGAEEKEIHAKRNVISTIGSDELDILPLPDTSGFIKYTSQNRPKGSHDLRVNPRFAANKDGVFSIKINGKEVRIDISFDDADYF
jgi:hypothetical protein